MGEGAKVSAARTAGKSPRRATAKVVVFILTCSVGGVEVLENEWLFVRGESKVRMRMQEQQREGWQRVWRGRFYM